LLPDPLRANHRLGASAPRDAGPNRRRIRNRRDGPEDAGGGIVAGQEQWGSFDFRIADAQRDHRILRAAERDAALLLEKPELQNSEVRTYLESLEGRIGTISFS